MEGKGGEGIRGKGRGRGPTPKGMVGDLLLREGEPTPKGPPHYRYWPPYSLNPGYGPGCFTSFNEQKCLIFCLNFDVFSDSSISA